MPVINGHGSPKLILEVSEVVLHNIYADEETINVPFYAHTVDIGKPSSEKSARDLNST